MKNMLIAASALGLVISALLIFWRRSRLEDDVEAWKGEADGLEDGTSYWHPELERNAMPYWSKN